MTGEQRTVRPAFGLGEVGSKHTHLQQRRQHGGGGLGTGVNKVRKSLVSCNLKQKGSFFLCSVTQSSLSEGCGPQPEMQKQVPISRIQILERRMKLVCDYVSRIQRRIGDSSSWG